MSWARFDDQMAFHPKVIDAGNEAVGLWVRMVAHSCAQLTDGKITKSLARSMGRASAIRDAIRAGLLERDGDDFIVHDFHDWNPRGDEVRAYREAERTRKAAGRAGQKRTEVRSASGQVPAVVRPDRQADVQSDVQPDGRTDSNKTPDGFRRARAGASPVSRLPSPIPGEGETRETLSGEPEPRAETGTGANGTPPVEKRNASRLPDALQNKNGNGQVCIRLSDPLPQLLRDAAQMNYQVVDVETAWLKFTGERDGRWVYSLAGEWQGFCASWKVIEGKQRARDRAYAERSNGHSKTIPGSTSADDGASTAEPAPDSVYAYDLVKSAPPGEMARLVKVQAERDAVRREYMREQDAKRHAANRAAVEAELAAASAALGSRTRLQVEQAIGGGDAVAVDSEASHGPTNGISEIRPKPGGIVEIQSGVKVAGTENTEEEGDRST